MQKKLTALVAFLITALVLVSCTVTVEPVEPPLIKVTATDDVAPEPLATVTQNRTIEVTVPGSLDGDLVVFEAAGPGTKRIVVRDSYGNVVGGSSSPHYFVPESGLGTLSDFSSELGTESVGATSKCIGPCVIVDSSNSTKKYTVEVRTTGESDFYAYASDYGDETEPQNNDSSSAPDLYSGDEVVGAFETVNDKDYYWIWDHTDVSITPLGTGYGSGLLLIVEIRDPVTPWTEVTPDEFGNFTVFSQTEMRVRTAGGYGGDFEASKYRISVD